MKETLKETNRLKSNCSARKQYLCTPHGTLSPASLFHAYALNETTETTPKRVMRYAISEITNPQSYCGEDRGFFFVQDDSHLKVLGELHYDGTDASINSIFFLF